MAAGRVDLIYMYWPYNALYDGALSDTRRSQDRCIRVVARSTEGEDQCGASRKTRWKFIGMFTSVIKKDSYGLYSPLTRGLCLYRNNSSPESQSCQPIELQCTWKDESEKKAVYHGIEAT
jgi:hypothetical protein